MAAAPDRLSKMALAARATGKPQAAALLADLVEAIAGGQSIADYSQGAST